MRRKAKRTTKTTKTTKARRPNLALPFQGGTGRTLEGPPGAALESRSS